MDQGPMFSAWVQFVGHVRDPLMLPGHPLKVFHNSVYNLSSKAAAIELMNQELSSIEARQGMEVLRPELEKKPLIAEYIMSPEFKLFVPMWNIRYIETVIKPMTELPRIEEPGIPLTGQGLEIKEHKTS
jgi:hypothetical protein